MTKAYHVVAIDENACIGCAKCLPACPVDAILGAPKHIHRILTEHCIGCDLCIPACPVHCINTETLTMPDTARKDQAKNAKLRVQARRNRIEKELAQKREQDNSASINIKASIAKSLERVQQKRQNFIWANNEHS